MGAAVGSFGRRRPGRFGRDFVKKSRHAGANRALPRSVKTVSLEARWRPHSPQEPTPKIMLSRTLLTSALVVSSLALTSCAITAPAGHTTGFISKNVGVGGATTYVEGQPLVLEGLERGESREYSLLGLFSWGDSSLDAAAEQGKLRDVRYIDQHVVSFLGILAIYETVALGKPKD
jgi:hypothetical protein